MSARAQKNRELLESAARDLYRHRDYASVTAAEIAARAGVTERTFFRHFSDKKEMFFSGSAEMTGSIEAAIHGAADEATEWELVQIALGSLAPLFENRAELVRERQDIINANPELRERELAKRNALSAAIARALRDRGCAVEIADISGALGGVVLHAAFTKWASSTSLSLSDALSESAARVSAIASP